MFWPGSGKKGSGVDEKRCFPVKFSRRSRPVGSRAGLAELGPTLFGQARYRNRKRLAAVKCGRRPPVRRNRVNRNKRPADFGRFRAHVGRNRPNSVQQRSNSGHIRPKSGRIAAEFEQIWSGSVAQFKLVRIQQKRAELAPKAGNFFDLNEASGHVWTHCGQLWVACLTTLGSISATVTPQRNSPIFRSEQNSAQRNVAETASGRSPPKNRPNAARVSHVLEIGPSGWISGRTGPNMGRHVVEASPSFDDHGITWPKRPWILVSSQACCIPSTRGSGGQIMI